ncbi:MAG TPA: AMP-binding protein [Candidatus Limnocylindrales bacterium]|nr:AMP-binding protein [Candidatus Limnocylindrales bacterium]
MKTLLDLLDDAVDRFADRPAVGLRSEDGTTWTWTYRELRRRATIAAWRLRALGLERGDRLLTWSPSTPELPAVYFGAMRAGLVLVPLDLRMAPDAIQRIVALAEPRHLALGTGRDAPDPRSAGLDSLPTTTLDALTAEPDDTFPSDWQAQLDAWPPPAPEDLFEVIFTSGTTAAPKGVMLAHDNVLAGVTSFRKIIPDLEHRIVSLLPLSHLFEQAVGLFYALSVGADIRYVRSRNPRVIFEAIREHRTTSMVVVPQILELFWSAIEREVERVGRRPLFDRLRRIARRLPMPIRRLLFRQVHRRLGGELRLFVSAGAFLPPAIQQAWEDLGVVVLQGYGSTETASGTCTTLDDHGLGTVGRPVPGIEMRLAPDGEVLFRGPSLFKGYWRDPEATRAAVDADGWYHTGDIGRLDAEGRLILMGRKKDIIVLPNGLNVYPEDIENELRVAGLVDAVVVETRPGRIEAIVLPPSRSPLALAAAGRSPGSAEAGRASAGAPFPTDPRDLDPADRERIETAIREANRRLAVHQRIAGWRVWPEADFPRTHTLKVKRDLVRQRFVEESPLPIREEPAGS